MTVSAGLYGSGNWVLSEKDKNRIQAAEMRFLRSTIGITRQYRLTNEAIRKKNIKCEEPQ
jgi:ABC-type ATPase involved in cell division